MQAGELLPDAACYDNCKDTPEQRHFLTCMDMACFCRKASSLNPYNGQATDGSQLPQQAAVPLTAGAVDPVPVGVQNTTATANTTIVPSDPHSNNTSSVVTPLNAGDAPGVAVGNSTAVSSNNATSNVPPANAVNNGTSTGVNQADNNAVTPVIPPPTALVPPKP